jgi:hypothetical protein
MLFLWRNGKIRICEPPLPPGVTGFNTITNSGVWWKLIAMECDSITHSWAKDPHVKCIYEPQLGLDTKTDSLAGRLDVHTSFRCIVTGNITEYIGQVHRKHYHSQRIGCQLASSVPTKLPLLKCFESGWKYVLASVIPCNISIYHNHQSLPVGLLLLCTEPTCRFTAQFFRRSCAVALYGLLSERVWCCVECLYVKHDNETSRQVRDREFIC